MLAAITMQGPVAVGGAGPGALSGALATAGGGSAEAKAKAGGAADGAVGAGGGGGGGKGKSEPEDRILISEVRVEGRWQRLRSGVGHLLACAGVRAKTVRGSLLALRCVGSRVILPG